MRNRCHLLRFGICFPCCSVLPVHSCARRGLVGTATLALTRRRFSSSCPKFSQILKIPSFSWLRPLAAALHAPEALELSSSRCQVSQALMGTGAMSSPGPRGSSKLLPGLHLPLLPSSQQSQWRYIPQTNESPPVTLLFSLQGEAF